MLPFGALARPLLFALEPETAHWLSLAALRLLPPGVIPPDDERLAVSAFGLRFSNPLGLAAGFDKNGVVTTRVLQMGFGFTEVGTVTPKAQPGNARPRVFRLIDDAAIINRLGFNNDGALTVHQRLARQRRQAASGIIGVNIGAGGATLDRGADYETGIGMFADVASYFTLNVSSPNTPRLRDLQRRDALDELLARVVDARNAVSGRYGRKPLLLKIAPDLTLGELDDVVTVARTRSIDGIIIGNTTVSRPKGLADHRRAAESGGLSGRPLFSMATRLLAAAYLRVERQFPLVGVGGVDGPDTAYAKIRAGASLLQLYTGLVFHGPAVIAQIKTGLLTALIRDGHQCIATVVGRDAPEAASLKA